MAVSGIRQRLKILEDTGLFGAPPVFRPLVSYEIEALIKKDAAAYPALDQQRPDGKGVTAFFSPGCEDERYDAE